MMKFNAGIILASSILLTACGGGGGGGGGSTTATPLNNNETSPPPETPSAKIQVSAQNGEMSLQWTETEVNGNTAECYRVSVRENENENYEEVEHCLENTSFTAELSVIDTDLAGISYLIEACDNTGACEEIDNVTLENEKENLVEKIPHPSVPGLEEFGYRTHRNTVDKSYLREQFEHGKIRHVLSEDESTLIYLLEHDSSTGMDTYADPTLGRSMDNATDEALGRSGAILITKKQGDEWVFDAFIKPPALENSPFIKRVYHVSEFWGNQSDNFPDGLELSADGNKITVKLPECGEMEIPRSQTPIECITSLVSYKRENGIWELTGKVTLADTRNDDWHVNVSTIPYAQNGLVVSGDGNTVLYDQPFAVKITPFFSGIINYPYPDQFEGHLIETSYSDDYNAPLSSSNVPIEILGLNNPVDGWTIQATLTPYYGDLHWRDRQLNHDGNLIIGMVNGSSNSRTTPIAYKRNDNTYPPTWGEIEVPLLSKKIIGIASNASGSSVIFETTDHLKVFKVTDGIFTPDGELPPYVTINNNKVYYPSNLNVNGRVDNQYDVIINSTGDEVLTFLSGWLPEDKFLHEKNKGYIQVNETTLNDISVAGDDEREDRNLDGSYLHFKKVNSEWKVVGLIPLSLPYYLFNHHISAQFLEGGILVAGNIYR